MPALQAGVLTKLNCYSKSSAIKRSR